MSVKQLEHENSLLTAAEGRKSPEALSSFIITECDGKDAVGKYRKDISRFRKEQKQRKDAKASKDDGIASSKPKDDNTLASLDDDIKSPSVKDVKVEKTSTGDVDKTSTKPKESLDKDDKTSTLSKGGEINDDLTEEKPTIDPDLLVDFSESPPYTPASPPTTPPYYLSSPSIDNDSLEEKTTTECNSSNKELQDSPDKESQASDYFKDLKFPWELNESFERQMHFAKAKGITHAFHDCTAILGHSWSENDSDEWMRWRSYFHQSRFYLFKKRLEQLEYRAICQQRPKQVARSLS